MFQECFSILYIVLVSKGIYDITVTDITLVVEDK